MKPLLIKSQKVLHTWAYLELIINFLLLVAGILYYLLPSVIISSRIIDYGYIISIIVSGILAYDAGVHVNKKMNSGNRMNLVYYGYYFYLIVGLAAAMLGNFLLSVSYEQGFSANFTLYLMIFMGYFGSIIYAMIVGYSVIYHAHWDGLWFNQQQNKSWSGVSERGLRSKKIILIILKAFALVILAVLIFFIFVLFAGNTHYILGWIGAGVSQFVLYYAIFGIAVTFTLMKTIDRRIKEKLFYIVMVIGLVISVLFITPLMLMPSAIEQAEFNFADAFGDDWEENIDDSTDPFFMDSHYSLAPYFLGVSQNNACIVKEHISYYNGTAGVDDGLELYFDAYLPDNYGIGLPGENATIIRIHGGGWAIGDKGVGNVLQLNKYFAAQGYCVFDIQYGLTNESSLSLPYITPEYLVGNFSIDDMLRHIGIFTQFLTANSAKYGADLSSVFISGGSAGGQLTCATALAIANGSYAATFGAGLTISGYIPYYPALLIDDIHDYLEGQDEFLDPRKLIEEDSPPCLIFQGTHDGLVDPAVSQSIKTTYTAENNNACAIIEMPLGAHGCDIYFSGFYSTTFLYYMERFLYMFR